ncbi:MAG: hypothetical protein OQK94_03455 [Gammaproteobacteria bacterium]|nr:hypothetical protein [Gammaproteobacteria bacterium]MCW8839750.1 hypothetical protein [Gammaproteobacteria bacterium]MCW8959272.1 hypothetical protein [Gammaproteobacteria bacterium]MCW8992437.1 hypothetical protein [Gammaproteobacteria bacterium]
MSHKSDPLQVLLDIKNKMSLDIDDELIKGCYEIQRDHQYDRDRDTLKKMKALIEEQIVSKSDDVMI